MARTRITTMSTSAALRTEVTTFTIPVPVEGQVVTLIAASKFPTQLMSVNRKVGGETANGCDLLFATDGGEIRFDDSQSDGVGIPCTEPSYVESIPNSGDDIINEDQECDMTIQNLESDVVDMVVQVEFRRLDDDVSIT